MSVGNFLKVILLPWRPPCNLKNSTNHMVDHQWAVKKVEGSQSGASDGTGPDSSLHLELGGKPVWRAQTLTNLSRNPKKGNIQLKAPIILLAWLFWTHFCTKPKPFQPFPKLHRKKSSTKITAFTDLFKCNMAEFKEKHWKCCLCNSCTVLKAVTCDMWENIC